MKFAKKHRIALLASGLTLLLVLCLNPLLEGVAQRYLVQKLVVQQESSPYAVNFSDLDLNVYTQELTLKGLTFSQISGDKSTGADNTSPGPRHLEMDRAVIRGVNLSNFLWNRSLDIHGVEMDTVRLTLFRSDGQSGQGMDSQRHEGFVLDSIRLPGITNVSLGSFQLNYFESFIRDRQVGDTLSRIRSSDLHLEGIELSEDGVVGGHTFVPVLDDLELRLGRQDYQLANGHYDLRYRYLIYRQRGQYMRIDSLAYLPRIGADSLASLNRYSFERYTASASSVELTGIELSRLLNTGNLHVASVRVDSLDLQIYKDKTKPIRPGHSIPMPTEALRELSFPFIVDSVVIANSRLKYYERLPDTDKHVEVSFHDLEGQVRNLRSDRYALPSAQPLTIHLETILLEALPIGLDLEFPYGSDLIRLRGRSSGSSKMSALNPTVFPALNLQFGNGRLDGISFQAVGNSRQMEGALTMLYSDLEVELFKADHRKNKALSWMANAIVKHSNPNRRGRTLVAEIQAERDAGKGVMNYVWKGIQSGVVNTFNPLGSHIKK